MDEPGVNHPVRIGGSAPQAVKVLKISPVNLRTRFDKRLRARIRPGEAEHLMACAD